MSDENAVNESSQHNFSKSTTVSTKMETSGRTVTAIEVSGQAVSGRSTSLPQVTLLPEDIHAIHSPSCIYITIITIATGASTNVYEHWHAVEAGCMCHLRINEVYTWARATCKLEQDRPV